MPFLTEPAIRRDGPRFWRLTEDLVYRGKHETWVIPAGFHTDLASIPRPFRAYFDQAGEHTRAAILHDYLCRPERRIDPVTGLEVIAPPVSRSDADGVFRRVLREDGVELHRRWVMWAAVRVGSGMASATGDDWRNVLLVGTLAVPVLAVPAAVNVGLLALLAVLDRAFPGQTPQPTVQRRSALVTVEVDGVTYRGDVSEEL